MGKEWSCFISAFTEDLAEQALLACSNKRDAFSCISQSVASILQLFFLQLGWSDLCTVFWYDICYKQKIGQIFLGKKTSCKRVKPVDATTVLPVCYYNHKSL